MTRDLEREREELLTRADDKIARVLASVSEQMKPPKPPVAIATNQEGTTHARTR